MDAYDYLTQFSKTLNQLSLFLDKAQAFADQRRYDSKKILAMCLAPDQFNLTRQVQIACDTAKFHAIRLTGKEAPVFEDKETSVEELKERIRKTVALLGTFSRTDFHGWEERKTTNPRREGKYLPGRDFAMQHSVPNFYFHVTTAYSILRSCGVELGKKDYLGDIPYRDL